MKTTAQILVVVALICVSLFAVHGFFLVRADLVSRKAPNVALQPVTPGPSTTPSAKPNPAVLKTDTPASPAAESDGRNGDPEAEARSAADWQAQQAKTPEIHTTTVSFMPAQAANFPNRKFRKVLIRSEYPVRILTGRCHSDYTVEFFCDGDPSDIFITDTRHRPVFSTPRANA